MDLYSSSVQQQYQKLAEINKKSIENTWKAKKPYEIQVTAIAQRVPYHHIQVLGICIAWYFGYFGVFCQIGIFALLVFLLYWYFCYIGIFAILVYLLNWYFCYIDIFVSALHLWYCTGRVFEVSREVCPRHYTSHRCEEHPKCVQAKGFKLSLPHFKNISDILREKNTNVKSFEVKFETAWVP